MVKQIALPLFDNANVCRHVITAIKDFIIYLKNPHGMKTAVIKSYKIDIARKYRLGPVKSLIG